MIIFLKKIYKFITNYFFNGKCICGFILGLNVILVPLFLKICNFSSSILKQRYLILLFFKLCKFGTVSDISLSNEESTSQRDSMMICSEHVACAIKIKHDSIPVLLQIFLNHLDTIL